MRNNDLFQRVRELNLSLGKYVIFGSGPLGIRGLTECNDIDILVTQNLWNEYKNKDWELRVMPHGSEYLQKNKIELWTDWKPGQWDVGRLIKDAEVIEGLPFVPLNQVLEWKKLILRAKDLKDIEIIEKILC